jgi:pimeloyl-ACP methyl ester carboxylesterase
MPARAGVRASRAARRRAGAAVVAALLAVVAAAGCGRARVERAPGACTRVQAQYWVRGSAVCEDVWSCQRPPGGELDRVGLRRVALCDGATGPLVLYLPGMFMNGELAGTDASHDVRLHLALAGVRTWAIDWRSHAVPATATPEQLRALAGWDRRTYVDDAAWAAGFVRGAEQGPLWLMGFSYGAGVAYDLAARGEPLAGLAILDGAPSEGGGAPRGDGPAIDVGTTHLPWEKRERLLADVVRDPRAPSPVPGYASAGDALAGILWTAPSFGGKGGLSAAREGVSDLPPLARLLLTYDRWWPRAALAGDEPRAPSTKLRVIAFASDNLGARWVARVRKGAHDFGGDQAVVRELPLHGHLDVLVGRLAPEEVYEPVLRFVSP